jgi:hypothetical protein
MEAQVASLLLIVASVAFSSIVVGFAAITMEQTLEISNDPDSSLRSYVNDMLNQTQSVLNGIQGLAANQTTTGP